MQLLDQDILSAARTANLLHRGAGRLGHLLVATAGILSIIGLAAVPVFNLTGRTIPDNLTGWMLVVSAAALSLTLLERYAHGVLEQNRTYTPDAARLLASVKAGEFVRRLARSPRVQYLLMKLSLTERDLAPEPLTPDQIAVAVKEKVSGSERGRRVDIGDLLLVAVSQSPQALEVLESQHLTQSDLLTLLTWERERNLESGPAFYGGFAKDWAAGYTLLLDKYSVDLSDYFRDRRARLHIFGHRQVIEAVARGLAKSHKANVLLVGDPGVGRKTAVLGLARELAAGRTLPELSWKHVKMLDTEALLAGAEPEIVEGRLITVLNEAARAGNVILFIDGLEVLLGGRAPGTVDASAILSKYLTSSHLQIIATTTYDIYHQRIEKDKSLAGQFDKVEVGEPSLAETELITLNAAVGVENEYRVGVSLAAVKEIVKLSERYLQERPFPEKALDLLDEVAVYVARQKQERLIQPFHVQEIVHRKTDIPVSAADRPERDVLMNLEERLHQRIVNQKEAVQAVSDALRRTRAGLKEKAKPIGSFLFLGPTGVGKTETAKAVAEAYFGHEDRLLRIDMNEYGGGGVSRLQQALTDRAREDPFQLVLFDEIEKASPEVRNLLLRVFDEGRLADEEGKGADLTNMIMVATSNAGAELIREELQTTGLTEGLADLKKRLLDHLQKEGVFAPEFLNRFDAVVLFQPLTPDQIGQVVELMLNRLNQQLKEQGVQVRLDQSAIDRLSKEGYDPVFGARALRRTLQDKVENVVAKRILAGRVVPNSAITLTAQDLQ